MGNLDDQAAHPADVRAAVNAEAALLLRMQGHSYAKIAGALGVSKATAWRLVTDALREQVTLTRETAEELRALELARLDDLWRRCYPALPQQKLDLATGRLLLRISMQRSLLLGLPVLRLSPGGADELPVPGDVDLSRLGVDELRTFERLLLVAQGGTPASLGLSPADEVFVPHEAEPGVDGADPGPEPEAG